MLKSIVTATLNKTALGRRVYEEARKWKIARLAPPPVNAGSAQLPVVSDPAELGRVALPATQQAIEAARAKVQTQPRDLPVSAFIINYNEAAVVEISLLSLWRFKELVVVDKGSTDGSMDICARYATKTAQAGWSPIVEDTRDMADSLCGQEWRIFLDADEYITPETIALIESVVRRDAQGDFPYDAIALPRVNYVFAELCANNLYKPTPIVRMYRRGAYQHVRATHRVALKDGARVYTPEPDSKAAIVHFNQDNVYEYIEKMNRYTETYTTAYPHPATARDLYDFALNKILMARKATLAQNGNAHDAACDLITAIYYTTEYIKQWERSRGLTTDTTYADAIRKDFKL